MMPESGDRVYYHNPRTGTRVRGTVKTVSAAGDALPDHVRIYWDDGESDTVSLTSLEWWLTSPSFEFIICEGPFL